MSKTEQELIDVVASEMASGVCEAVGHWLADINEVLQDEHSTAREKLDEIAGIVSEYRNISHHSDLRPRIVAATHGAPQRMLSVNDAI